LSGRAEKGIFYRMAAQAANYADNKDGKRRSPSKVTAASQPQPPKGEPCFYHMRTSLSSGCEKTILKGMSIYDKQRT